MKNITNHTEHYNVTRAWYRCRSNIWTLTRCKLHWSIITFNVCPWDGICRSQLGNGMPSRNFTCNREFVAPLYTRLNQDYRTVLWDINTVDSRYLEFQWTLWHNSTYQICRIEEKLYRTNTFNKCICNLTPEVRDVLKTLWRRWEIAPQEQFLLFSTIFCYLLLDFHV